MRLALLAAVVAALAMTAQAGARETCSAGVKTTSGVTYRTFCGGAKATLKFGGKTYLFTGGSCDTTAGTFTINIGTITLPPGKPKYRYFGMTVFTARDGTFMNQAVSWQFPGGLHNALFHVTVKLAGGRKHGTFRGTTLTDQKPGTGTFTC